MKCRSYNEVYRKYTEILKDIVGERKDLDVLKTDCYNESGKNPVLKPLVPLLIPHCKHIQVYEIDENIIEAAKRNTFMYHDAINIEIQDLRTYDTKERNYDIIFDFSTIDHMNFDDATKVLNKYQMSLKSGGILSLVVWLNSIKNMRDRDQYSFRKDSFKKCLRKLFRIIYAEHLISAREHELWYFRMTKRKRSPFSLINFIKQHGGIADVTRIAL